MTEKQLSAIAVKVARKYRAADSVRRSDIIRDVVRTRKLNLADSITLADCIVKGLYEAGKSVTVTV